jgi:Ca2+-binding RTX toxin-like protein
VDNGAQQVDITGTTTDVAPGATVNITITDQNGTTVTTTATVQPDGSYSVDNVDVSTLADGPLATTATATDNNGSPVTDTDNDVLDAVNGPPVANDDTLTATEDTAVTYTAAQLLGNDTDPEGNPLSIASVSSGLGGTAVLNPDGTVTFTPDANFSGIAQFTYTASDGTQVSASATVAVNVAPVADAPTLAPVSNIYVLNAGNTVITTGSQDVTFTAGTSATYERGAGVSQANLELELGVGAGYLDGRFDPVGPNINDPDAVDVVDGKLTEQHYSMGAGTTVTWNYSFANGEDLQSEVSGGYNDLVVVVVTDPLGGKTSYLVDSSETKFPALSFTGNYSFTATMDGAYTFQWLVLNGLDAYKDSWLSIGTPSFVVPGMVGSYSAPIDLSSISAGLVDRDGSEGLSVTIAGVPAGAIFDAGTNNGDGSWTFTQAELADLHLLPAAGYNGTMNLVITATATELATGDSASVTQNLNIEISSTTTTYTESTQAAQTLAGTAGNDLIRGYAGNDTVNAGGGNDMVYGGAGNDTVNGDAGNDWLYGGVGDDRLNGGTGNDQLVGGLGNDILSGGTGADTFRWEFADKGAASTADTITDFDLTPNSDRLDLRDLLVGESHGGTDAGNLGNYLHFEQSGTATVIKISTSGGFASGYNAGAVDQQITLNNVDLTSLGSDQQIIQNLLTNGKLVTD